MHYFNAIVTASYIYLHVFSYCFTLCRQRSDKVLLDLVPKAALMNTGWEMTARAM